MHKSLRMNDVVEVFLYPKLPKNVNQRNQAIQDEHQEVDAQLQLHLDKMQQEIAHQEECIDLDRVASPSKVLIDLESPSFVDCGIQTSAQSSKLCTQIDLCEDEDQLLKCNETTFLSGYQ